MEWDDQALTRVSSWVLYPTKANGADAHLVKGYSATRSAPGRCNPDWFASDQTIVLGLEARQECQVAETTEVEWWLLIPNDLVRKASETRLIVACQRRTGGLHTKQKNARARILLNGKAVEIFSLNSKPEGHDDYFCRQPVPHDCNVPPCDTVYHWHFSPGLLRKGKQLHAGIAQNVRLELDPEINWDIDYVGFAIKTTRWTYRKWVVAVLMLVLAALIEELMRRFLS
jgi:hypothetical protein